MAKLFVLFISSVGGLLAADYFVTGFSITHDPVPFVIVALIFTVLQLILRPILKFIFMPFILLTLGLFTLVLNALLLGLLDFLSSNLTIEGLEALLFGTLIMTAAHFLASVLWYPSKKDN